MGESIAAYTVSMGKLEGRRNMENTKVDGRIILKLILEKKNRGIDWIDLVQDRDRWRALVNSAMNLRVP